MNSKTKIIIFGVVFVVLLILGVITPAILLKKKKSSDTKNNNTSNDKSKIDKAKEEEEAAKQKQEAADKAAAEAIAKAAAASAAAAKAAKESEDKAAAAKAAKEKADKAAADVEAATTDSEKKAAEKAKEKADKAAAKAAAEAKAAKEAADKARQEKEKQEADKAAKETAADKAAQEAAEKERKRKQEEKDDKESDISDSSDIIELEFYNQPFLFANYPYNQKLDSRTEIGIKMGVNDKLTSENCIKNEISTLAIQQINDIDSNTKNILGFYQYNNLNKIYYVLDDSVDSIQLSSKKDGNSIIYKLIQLDTLGSVIKNKTKSFNFTLTSNNLNDTILSSYDDSSSWLMIGMTGELIFGNGKFIVGRFTDYKN